MEGYGKRRLTFIYIPLVLLNFHKNSFIPLRLCPVRASLSLPLVLNCYVNKNISCLPAFYFPFCGMNWSMVEFEKCLFTELKMAEKAEGRGGDEDRGGGGTGGGELRRLKK